MNRSTVITLAVALCAAVAIGVACDEDTAATNGIDPIVDAWKRAGMTPTTLAPRDGTDLANGTCHAGRVDGLHVIVCEYASEVAARDARTAGLKVVGTTTGAALASGNRLLVVADRDDVDPSGRAINKLTRAYLTATKPATSVLGS